MTEQESNGQPVEPARVLGPHDMYGYYGSILVSEFFADVLRKRQARKAEERVGKGLPPRRTLFRRRAK